VLNATKTILPKFMFYELWYEHLADLESGVLRVSVPLW